MKTIVIQETDDAVRDVLTIAFETEGFNVRSFADCEACILAVMDRAKAHAVLLDFKLKGETATRTCQLIKSAFPILPVLATSCNSEIRKLYKRSGFDGYIEKPFDLDRLYHLLQMYVPS